LSSGASNKGRSSSPPGCRVDVEPQGTLAGSLDVDGVIRNRGIRGGAVSGAGVVDDLPGATVKRTVVRNGTTDIGVVRALSSARP
jgi:hypothetical protein